MEHSDDFVKSDSSDSAGSPLKRREQTGITSVWIDNFLNYLRKGYFSKFLDKNVEWLTKWGLNGLYVSAILGLLTSLYVPYKYDQIEFSYSIAAGFVWVLVCIVAHYTAVKFLPNLDRIIKATPTKLTSGAFTDSFALIAGIGGVASLVAGAYFSISAENVDQLVYGVFAFIFCEYLMSLSLNPENLGIEITEKTTAGEELLGILSFIMKGFLRLIPVLFGSGIILGIVRTFDIWFGDVEYIQQLVGQVSAVGSVTAAAFLPVTGYLAFLLYYFSIDVLTSIIAIPQKLDNLSSSKDFVAAEPTDAFSSTNENPQNDSGNNTSVSPVEFDELMSKGGRCIQSKEYEEAIALFTAAIDVNEASGEAYYMRAIAYSKVKNKNDAIKDIKAAAKLGNEKAIKYLDRKNMS